MASEGSDSDSQIEAPHEPRECMACRGTGRVISNLGGTPSTVTCPWCEGGGIRLQGIDAQARWLDDARDEAHSESPTEPPAEPPSEPPAESPAESPDPAA